LGGTSRADLQQSDPSPKVQRQPDSLNDNRAATTTQPSSQEQSADVKEALMNAQELLAKANGSNSGTCNNSCHCAVA
jgi:hypothetical protein